MPHALTRIEWALGEGKRSRLLHPRPSCLRGRSVITWPRVCEGCPTSTSQTFVARFTFCCRRPKGSASMCEKLLAMRPEEVGLHYSSARDSSHRTRSTRNDLSPIARISAEQPRLALAESDKNLPESIARPSTPNSVACQRARPLAMEFFRPSSADGHGPCPDTSEQTSRRDSVRYRAPRPCGRKADPICRKVGAPSALSPPAGCGIVIPTLMQRGPACKPRTCRDQGLPGR